eukprot:6008317-Amphidinium_carterae.1
MPLSSKTPLLICRHGDFRSLLLEIIVGVVDAAMKDTSMGLPRMLVLLGGKDGLEALACCYSISCSDFICACLKAAISEGDCRRVQDTSGNVRYYFMTEEVGEEEQTQNLRSGKRTFGVSNTCG